MQNDNITLSPRTRSAGAPSTQGRRPPAQRNAPAAPPAAPQARHPALGPGARSARCRRRRWGRGPTACAPSRCWSRRHCSSGGCEAASAAVAPRCCPHCHLLTGAGRGRVEARLQRFCNLGQPWMFLCNACSRVWLLWEHRGGGLVAGQPCIGNVRSQWSSDVVAARHAVWRFGWLSGALRIRAVHSHPRVVVCTRSVPVGVVPAATECLGKRALARAIIK
jgi:hypothetical protein